MSNVSETSIVGWMVVENLCDSLMLLLSPYVARSENRIVDEPRLWKIPFRHRIWDIWDPDLVFIALPTRILKVKLLAQTLFFYMTLNCLQQSGEWCAEIQYLLPLVSCLWQIAKALSVWVLPQVHEEQNHPPETRQKVRLVSPTSQWDLPKGWPLRVWGQQLFTAIKQ